MIRFLVDLLKAILRSVIISVVLFVITYSLITKEFPPKWDKVKKSWSQLQRLSEMSHSLVSVPSSNDDEQAFQQVSQIVKERAKMGAQFLNEAPDNFSVIEENKNLKEKLRKLEVETTILSQKVLTLKDRLDALEEKSKR